MVDFLKQWTLGVCMTSLFCALIFALAPNDNMKKSVRLACSVCIIAAIFLPFVGTLSKVKLDDDLNELSNYSDIQNSAEYSLSAALSDEITQKIDIILTQNRYAACEINIAVNTDDNGIVTIKRVDIKTPNSRKVDGSTQEKLYEILGEDTLIIFS